MVGGSGGPATLRRLSGTATSAEQGAGTVDTIEIADSPVSDPAASVVVMMDEATGTPRLGSWPPEPAAQPGPEARASIMVSDVARQLGIYSGPSQWGTLDDGVIEDFVGHITGTLRLNQSTPAEWNDDTFWPRGIGNELRSQYFAVGNAINFRFWALHNGKIEPTGGYLRGEYFRGSSYMWRSLRLRIEVGDLRLFDPHYLANLRPEDLRDAFLDDQGSFPLEPGWHDRLRNLRDLGAKLLKRWSGSFINVVGESQASLVTFAGLSGEFRAYDDPLYKLTMVNAIMHQGAQVTTFLEPLLPGIDYQLLKHLLRHGVLLPAEAVATKLKERVLLPADQAAELRRLSMIAFIRLSEASGVGCDVLDNAWWFNRVNCLEETPVCVTDRRTACPFLTPCRQLVEYATPAELTRYY